MLEQEVQVTDALGLHARASARLVRLASRFTSNVTLSRDDTGVQADAKCILSILHVAAPYGTSLRLIIDGKDEGEAMREIVELFERGLAEN